MTEYQEITQNYTIEDCDREIKYQTETLGYNLGDSFPQFLVDLREELRTKKWLITEIMQKCAVSMKYGLDDVFLKLIGLSIPELRKIAQELYIKVD